MFRLLSALIHMPYFSLLEFMHRCHDAFAYYKQNPQFRKADWAIFKAYLFRNPYAICRRHFKKIDSPENTMQQIYGETFLMTFELIIKRAAISQHDIIFELGCGRGRGCFFLASQTKAEVIGIDINPLFIKKAQKIAATLDLPNVSFQEESIFDSDLSRATVIYFYGIAFNDTATVGLIEKFSQLPAGIQIVCVGFSLNDYYDEPLFKELDEFQVFYLWGKTTIWICETLGLPQDEALATDIIAELTKDSDNLEL